MRVQFLPPNPRPPPPAPPPSTRRILIGQSCNIHACICCIFITGLSQLLLDLLLCQQIYTHSTIPFFLDGCHFSKFALRPLCLLTSLMTLSGMLHASTCPKQQKHTSFQFPQSMHPINKWSATDQLLKCTINNGFPKNIDWKRFSGLSPQDHFTQLLISSIHLHSSSASKALIPHEIDPLWSFSTMGNQYKWQAICLAYQDFWHKVPTMNEGFWASI